MRQVKRMAGPTLTDEKLKPAFQNLIINVISF